METKVNKFYASIMHETEKGVLNKTNKEDGIDVRAYKIMRKSIIRNNVHIPMNKKDYLNLKNMNLCKWY